MTKEKLDVFIGPCVLESADLADTIAAYLADKLSKWNQEINIIFKGSFDKANRSSINSYRGPGIEKGLKILEDIRTKYHFPVVTDFHTPDMADEVAATVDVLQIPAFLCRQTDMILEGAQACKKYNRILKVKKGQFLSPEDTKNIVEKAGHFLNKKHILLTERGSSFGYQNLIVDMSSFQIMKSFGVKTVYDATHSVQMPGGLGTSTGGKREQILVLTKAAIAAGADGLFVETHPEPQKALSDAATCLPLEKIEELIDNVLKIYRVV